MINTTQRDLTTPAKLTPRVIACACLYAQRLLVHSLRVRNYRLLSLLTFGAFFLLLSFSSVSQQNTIYRYTDNKGIVTFSDLAPEHIEYQQIIFDCYACDPNSQINWQRTPLILEKYKSTVLTQAILHGIEPSLLFAIIHAESHFNPNAVSKVGAQGLMQIMPTTAKHLGLTTPFELTANIKAGAKYFAQLLNKYRGNTTLACAAYNAGMSNVDKYGGIPPFKETQAYITRINILQKRYKQALNS